MFNILYIDDFELSTPPANFIDWCNLTYPNSINVNIYQQTEVTAKIQKAGVTDGIGQGANMSVWIRYGSQGTKLSSPKNRLTKKFIY